GFERHRNSLADANVCGCQPAESIRDPSDSRTDTSSSMTYTSGVIFDSALLLTSVTSVLAVLIFAPFDFCESMQPVDSHAVSMLLRCGQPNVLGRRAQFQTTGVVQILRISFRIKPRSSSPCLTPLAIRAPCQSTTHVGRGSVAPLFPASK